jgi:hypothetical protein
VALGVLGRLRPHIISTLSTTRVVGHQPNTMATFTPGEIPDTNFQRLSRPQGTWFCRKEPQKKSQVTPPGINPRTVLLVVQCLNHYATPGPPLHDIRLQLIIQILFFNVSLIFILNKTRHITKKADIEKFLVARWQLLNTPHNITSVASFFMSHTMMSRCVIMAEGPP